MQLLAMVWGERAKGDWLVGRQKEGLWERAKTQRGNDSLVHKYTKGPGLFSYDCA